MLSATATLKATRGIVFTSLQKEKIRNRDSKEGRVKR